MSHARGLLLGLALLTGCPRSTLVGSLTCTVSADCAPPSLVCSADGRCVPGCTADPDLCGGGSTCDPTSGECSGGAALISCASDDACNPPDLICRGSTMTCVPGCTASDTCATGFICDPKTGRCCDPATVGCGPPPASVDAGAACNTDSECVGAPVNICSAGACVPGCAATGCAAPLSCDAASGHCSVASCARDSDCDNGSYCTPAASCSVLAFGGAISCAGGTRVYYRCAITTAPQDFSGCVGPAGPSGCPYCIDSSCLHAGLCQTSNECHRGDACVGGLCRVQPPECPQTVSIEDVVMGRLAAGKEVCVRGVVTAVSNGYDGMIDVRLGTMPYLFVDLMPIYQLAAPPVGKTVTVHGTVRWDESHDDHELLPVDWVSP